MRLYIIVALVAVIAYVVGARNPQWAAQIGLA